jgi:hypothetical protein
LHIIANIISYGVEHHDKKNRKQIIYWNFSVKLEYLYLADDLYLLSQNFRDTNQEMKNLIKIAKGDGLKTNSQKSKIIRINGKTTEGIKIEGQL